METYVAKLKQLRQEKKLSLEEVATALNLSPAFLNLIELGELLPTSKQQEAIAAYVIDNL